MSSPFRFSRLLYLPLALFASQPASATVIRTLNCLPPVASEYVSTVLGFHQGWPIGTTSRIEFGNPAHKQFSSCTSPPTTPGPPTQHVFSSTLTGVLTTDGLNPVPVNTLADVTVLVTFSSLVGSLLTLDTEIVQFDIGGGTLPPNIVLRQSQTNRSLGRTTIEDLGGSFRIDSFFDVWTDLSLDGGQSWIPSDISGRVVLQDIPEPSSVLLLLSGVAALVLAKRRR